MENRKTNSSKLISIIVPVYNVEAYLRECVDSILAQTYENLEVILVDDGSPDNSGAICDEYANKDNRVKVIHQPNNGVGKARNSGIDAATGEYLSFIDSDDTISPDMYEKMYRRIIETDADICICGFRMIYEDYERFVKVPHERKMSTKELWEACLMNFREYTYLLNSPINKLYRRNLLESAESSPIRFDEELPYHQCAIFNNDCCANAKHGIVFINFFPYSYQATVSNSLSKDTKYEVKEMLTRYIFNTILSALPERKAEIENALECQLSVYKVIILHIAVINRLPVPYKLKWSTVSTILRYSRSHKEKLSALLIYILPSPLYRAVYKLYSKGTMEA